MTAYQDVADRADRIVIPLPTYILRFTASRHECAGRYIRADPCAGALRRVTDVHVDDAGHALVLLVGVLLVARDRRLVMTVRVVSDEVQAHAQATARRSHRRRSRIS